MQKRYTTSYIIFPYINSILIDVVEEGLDYGATSNATNSDGTNRMKAITIGSNPVHMNCISCL